jgi:potassium uptake TrkH family protein
VSASSQGVRARLLWLPRLHPAQTVVVAFAAVILAGSGLLLLPISSTTETTPLQALFTATSAVTVTGLAVVDTATHWSVFGQVVIMVLIQAGGFGIMTFASVLGLVVARRLGLRSRLTAATEGRALGAGDLRSVLIGVARAAVAIELLVAVMLAGRFMIGYDASLGTALWRGAFHAVSAFNNAGFGLHSDNLVPFASDAWVCLPIAFGVILGGLGFPVLFELWRTIDGPWHRSSARLAPAVRSAPGNTSAAQRWVMRARRRRGSWTLNTTLVLVTSAVLLCVGTGWTLALEWSNPGTLGALDPAGRVLAAFFHSTVSRTAGFNSVDIGAMHPATLLGTDILMFVGGGPASTAGGMKVTTFAVLTAIVLSEVRGDGAANAFGKRIPRAAQRQAMTVAALGVFGVISGTMALMLLADVGLDRSLFEVTSAFATVGLSTGITADLPAAAKVVLIVLMFAGRLGPVTVASAIALRRQRRLYEYPKERPIIG